MSNFFNGLRIFLILRPHPGLAYPTTQRKCYWPTKVHTPDILRCNSYWFLTTLVHIQDPLWLLSCWRCRALMMMNSPLLSPLWSQQHQRELHVASSLTLSFYLFICCFDHFSDKSPKRLVHDGRPAWMRTLHTTATEWLSVIPQVHYLFSVVMNNVHHECITL